jgi:hypothetical protein
MRRPGNFSSRTDAEIFRLVFASPMERLQAMNEMATLPLPALAGRSFAAKLNPLHIQRTSYPTPALVQDMGINHRRLYILMTKQFLDRANVIAGIE